MIERPSSEMWGELRAGGRPAGDQIAVRALTDGDQETALLLGVDADGELHLLIPLPEEVAAPETADLTVVRLRSRRIEGRNHLDLVATPAHEHIFTPFCWDVLQAVHTRGRDPDRAVPAILRAWQSAWRPAQPTMDKATQVGLLGELYLLHRLMLPVLGPLAIEQWSGPDREKHDFVGERLHLEVKTTRRARPEHEISRLDQLRCPDGRTLLLASVQLDISAAGDLSIPDLIDAVVREVQAEPGAAYRFLSKVAAVGWSDSMRTSGELMRVFLRDAAVYRVDGRFPRLADNFIAPPGVVAMRYTISLANLPPLDAAEARRLIRDANGIPG